MENIKHDVRLLSNKQHPHPHIYPACSHHHQLYMPVQGCPHSILDVRYLYSFFICIRPNKYQNVIHCHYQLHIKRQHACFPEYIFLISIYFSLFFIYRIWPLFKIVILMHFHVHISIYIHSPKFISLENSENKYDIFLN